MENTRQQKIAKQIQKDVADIFQKEGAAIVRGLLVTVTAVRVSPDFGYAKIYISVFPFDRSQELMGALEQNGWFIRRALGQRIRNQLKSVPEIQFFLDDSLEYIEHIDQALKKSEIAQFPARRLVESAQRGRCGGFQFFVPACFPSSSPAVISSRPLRSRSSG